MSHFLWCFWTECQNISVWNICFNHHYLISTIIIIHEIFEKPGTLIGLQNPASWKTHPVILAKARKMENSKPGYLDNLKLEFHNYFYRLVH